MRNLGMVDNAHRSSGRGLAGGRVHAGRDGDLAAIDVADDGPA
jgi:hypothetical protein